MNTQQVFLPGSYPWKTISSLKEGANANQLSPLPGFLNKNSSSLVDDGEVATDTFAHWVEKGVVAGPFIAPPLELFRSNTMFAVHQKDKTRIIMNLATPEGSSYNENIRPFAARMSSAKLFSFSLLESGKNAIMSKHDWVDAYKNIPVRTKDLRLQGFSWLGRFFVETSLPFGSGNSAEEFDNLGELVLGIACSIS